jgi:hypothetical protein
MLKLPRPEYIALGGALPGALARGIKLNVEGKPNVWAGVTVFCFTIINPVCPGLALGAELTVELPETTLYVAFLKVEKSHVTKDCQVIGTRAIEFQNTSVDTSF